MSKKPVLLCIMDGFGWTPNETYGNAVAAAKKPFLDSLMAKYPMTTIEASGMAVGLPDGQMDPQGHRRGLRRSRGRGYHRPVRRQHERQELRGAAEQEGRGRRPHRRCFPEGS